MHLQVIGDGMSSSCFRDNFWPEVVSGHISSMFVEEAGVDVCGKFGYSKSNRSEIFIPLISLRTITSTTDLVCT